MLNFSQIEETGKAVVAFVEMAKTQIASLVASNELLHNKVDDLTAKVARLEASHETIMGWLAESDDDTIADAVIEIKEAAADLTSSAASVEVAAAETTAAVEASEATAESSAIIEESEVTEVTPVVPVVPVPEVVPAEVVPVETPANAPVVVPVVPPVVESPKRKRSWI